MTDEELEYLIAYNYGDVQENPWFGSILSRQPKIEDFDELSIDLTEVPDDEKLNYTDIDYEAEED